MATTLNERVAFGFIATKGDASRVDASGNNYGPRALIVPITDLDLHFISAADRDTDWNVANPTHPTLYIHSETTPATDYMTLYHDATNGYLNVVGGNIALQTAGTTRLTISATALTFPDDEILALGTDGDIALVNQSTVLNANTALTSVLIGTPVTPAVAANSLILSNITASGDLLLAANNGGNSQAWLWVDSSAGTMTIYGAGTAVAIVASTYFEIEDGVLLALGNDADQVLVNRTTILNANTALTGVLIGTPITPAVAANSLIVSNATASGDILVAGNLAGNSQAWLWVDTSASLMTLYGAGVSAIEVGTNIVVNEGSADRDFRIEGDNNANMVVIDAGTDSMALGRAVVAGAFAALDGSAVNRDGVTNVGRGLHMPAATFTQTNADPTTLAVGARVFIGVPTFAGANPNQTMSDVGTVYIAGIPVAGTNMTITRATSILFGREVNHVMRVEGTTTAATAGGNFTILSGAGSTSGAGGTLAITAGAGGASGNGGPITITAGASGATSGSGGALTILTGTVTYQATGTTGALIVGSGNSDTSNAAGGGTGNVTLRSGTYTTATWSNAGGGSVPSTGTLTIQTGAGVHMSDASINGGAAGALSILGGAGGNAAGAGTTGGAGAAIAITAGNSGNGVTAAGVPGNVTITAGSTGTGGNVNGGTVKFVAGAGVGSGTTGIVAATSGLLNDYRTITTIGTDSDVVYTAAQVRTGVINRETITANRNDSMPTAANLVAGLPGAYVGQSFFFVLNNNDDASTLTMTTAAAGITYDGNVAALAAGAARLYLVVITNVTASSEAATVFGL